MADFKVLTPEKLKQNKLVQPGELHFMMHQFTEAKVQYLDETKKFEWDTEEEFNNTGKSKLITEKLTQLS